MMTRLAIDLADGNRIEIRSTRTITRVQYQAILPSIESVLVAAGSESELDLLRMASSGEYQRITGLPESAGQSGSVTLGTPTDKPPPPKFTVNLGAGPQEVQLEDTPDAIVGPMLKCRLLSNPRVHICAFVQQVVESDRDRIRSIWMAHPGSKIELSFNPLEEQRKFDEAKRKQQELDGPKETETPQAS